MNPDEERKLLMPLTARRLTSAQDSSKSFDYRTDRCTHAFDLKEMQTESLAMCMLHLTMKGDAEHECMHMHFS